MGIKKVLLISSISIVLAAGILGIYVYYKLNRTSHLPEYIPAGAQMVVYLNSKALFKKFALGGDTSLKLEKLKDNLYIQSIGDMKEVGLDLFADAAFVQYKSQLYGLFIIDDVKKLETVIEKFPDTLISPIQEKGHYKTAFSTRDSFLLVWNRRLLVFIPKPNALVTDKFLDHILSISKAESFSTNKHFRLTKQDDAILWFYADRPELKISIDKPFKGYLQWDTSIHVYASENLSAPFQAHQTPMDQLPMNYVYADTGNHFVSKVIKSLVQIHLPMESAQLRDILPYKKIFMLKGRRELRNEVIRYEYDDNFNKKKIVKVELDTVNAAGLYLSGLDGRYNMTNISDTIDWALHQKSASTVLDARFNQEILGPFNTLMLNFEVRIHVSVDNGLRTMRTDVKTGDLEKLSGLKP
jgi:hypothetical protein